MPTFQEAFRAAVLRLVRREVRAVALPLKQELRWLRRRLAGLPRTVESLSRNVAEVLRERVAQRAHLQATEQEVRSARFSPQLIRKLRARLKLTQGALARLVGVSVAAVRAWEAGRARPQGTRRSALVGLRKLGRRQVVRLLATQSPSGGPRRRPRPRRRGRRRGRGRAK